jgi:hypothetical protein
MFDEGLKGVRLENITKIECAPKATQQFDEQGVHLSPSSRKIFVEGIILFANRFFNTVDLTLDVDHK